MLNGNELGTGFGELSVTVTVKLNVPTLVGMPLSDPSLPRVTPGGRFPAVMLQVNGRNPPVVPKVNTPYGVPATPAGGTGIGFKVSWAGVLMVIWVADGGPLTGVCALSVAVTENLNVPALVGVPDTVPSLANTSPGGSTPLACHV